MSGKVTARITTVTAVIVIGASLFAGRQRIIEEWYLSRLKFGSGKEKLAAIEYLGDIGSEGALLKIMEFESVSFPRSLLYPLSKPEIKLIVNNISMPPRSFGGRGLKSVEAQDFAAVPLWEKGERTLYDGPNIDFNNVIKNSKLKINRRLGNKRIESFCISNLNNACLDGRVRIMMVRFLLFSCSDRNSEIIFRSPNCIDALITLLSSGDDFVRALAAITLGRCGKSASIAIGALEKATRDYNEQVQFVVIEALRNIKNSSW